jgi:rubrerythrin
MSARREILEILQKAYQIEVDGHTFYAMTAARAEKPAVRELFDKLANDEIQHQAYLKAVLSRFDTEGMEAFRLNLRTPEFAAFSQRVFTDRFREQARGAEFEIAVLSIGMQLENSAISHFTSAAANADSVEVREFYRFLADWEKQHLVALQSLFNSVKTDFWAEAVFAPF